MTSSPSIPAEPVAHPHRPLSDSSRRDVGVDIIRSLAILCVIAVHALPQTVPLSQGINRETSSLAMRVLTQLLQMTGQLGVPLFIAITGYLMLDRDYSGQNLTRFIRHNLLPILVSFEVWNILMAIIEQAFITPIVTVKGVIKAALFLGDTPMGHIWYLQMIVGVYCALPLLAFGLKKIRECQCEYYLVAFTCILLCFRSAVPTIEQFARMSGHTLNIDNKFSPIVSDLAWILIPLLIGYAIRRGAFDRLSSGSVYALFTASIVFLTTDGYYWLMNGEPGKPLLPDYRVNDSFIVFAVFTTFLTIERIARSIQMPQQASELFKSFAQHAYGIYIIHFPIVWKLAFFWQPTTHSWLNFAIYCVVALAPSYLVSICLSHVPVVGYWLMLSKRTEPISVKRIRG